MQKGINKEKILITILGVVLYFALCQSASAVDFSNTTGNMTISAGTTMVVDGDKWIRGGDLTVGPGGILQINSNSSLQFEPGHKIIISGGQIFQSANHGIIKKGNLTCECISGDCCDGCSYQPATYTCRAVAGVCDVAETCTGSSATCPANLYVANNTQVSGCTGTCQACQSGSCSVATAGTDPGSLCPYATQSQQGGDPNWCQQSIKDGNCNASGACNGYGSWSNINESLVCWSTGYCSGDTYYGGKTCLSGICSGNASGCCQGSKCSAGNYCRESDHSCQPVPVCQIRNETGFGTTNDTNNTQVTNCNGACQACQNGACSIATAGTDPGSLCPINNQYQQGGDPYYCQMRSTDGNCNASGACNTTYGGWSNVNEGQICASTGYCSGDTYYVNSTCSAGICTSNASGCCQGSYCAAGNYCRQSDHSCQPVPVCQIRNETGFGTTNVTNNTQVTNCNGACQACQNGACSIATAGTDPGNQCTEGYACSGLCAETYTSGLCYNGACKAGVTTNCSSGYACSTSYNRCYDWVYCDYTDYCSGNTRYTGKKCDGSTNCTVLAGDIGCCQGNKCPSGQYCESSTYTCTALPDCATRVESGFGYTSTCAANYCYRDIDGDGWPAASGTKTCQSSPILYKTDCCDTDAGVHPGIPDPPERSTPSACGGWDLNCDGSVTTSGYDCAKCSSCYVSGSTCSILCSNPRPTHNATCPQAACGETFSATRCAATLYGAGCGTFNVYYYKTGTDNVTCSDWQGGGLKSTTLQGYGTQTCKCK